jgi:hypothetical protein
VKSVYSAVRTESLYKTDTLRLSRVNLRDLLDCMQQSLGGSFLFALSGKRPRSRRYGRTAALKASCAALWRRWRWRLLFCPFPANGGINGMKLTGENRGTRVKACPSATLPTTNPTWTDPGSHPGLRGGTPAANRLSHGTAHGACLSLSFGSTN